METPERLSVSLEAWSRAAAADLGDAMPADDLAGLDGLAEAVEVGSTLLFGVYGEAGRVGSFALRFDNFRHGSEAVIVAAAGRLAGVNLTASVLPLIEAMAWKAGALRVRGHTDNPAQERHMRRYGYRRAEVIFVKERPDGLQKLQ